MKNNYNSKNNNDKSINGNDNNVTSLILTNNVFSITFKLMFLFNELGNLFQTEGPIYEIFFYHMLVFRKGTSRLA